MLIKNIDFIRTTNIKKVATNYITAFYFNLTLIDTLLKFLLSIFILCIMINSSLEGFLKRSFLFLFLIITGASLGQQAPSIVWEYKEKEGSGEFIKADSQGNLIVVGSTDYISSLGSYSRIRIIKQDKNANIIWQHVYVDSVTSYPDKAFDIALDTFDNIYIAGRTNFDSSLPPPDFSQSLVLKYDTHGNLLWVRKWGNNLQMGGGINRMKLFENRYLCVVGYMDSWITGYKNSFILQYDSSGVLNWLDTTNANFDNFFVDVEQDKLGNSYIIGVTACCLPGFDTRVVKYDLGGNVKWSRVLTDSIHPYSYPKDAVIDDSSNIYVGGETKKISGPNDFDIFMSKIDSSGNEKWWTTYATTADSNWDVVVGVSSDCNYDNYLYGYVLPYGSGGNTVAVITKITKSGVVDWSWRYDTLNNGVDGFFYKSILSKDSDIVFVGGGKSINSTIPGILAVSFKSNGTIKWIFENSCRCYFNSIIEEDSSFYATGYDYTSPFTNMDSLFICRLSQDSVNSTEAVKLDSDIRIYPNPFTTEFYINASNRMKPVEITFINMLGETVLRSKFYHNKINTSYLPQGLYTLKIEFSDHSFSKIKVSKI